MNSIHSTPRAKRGLVLAMGAAALLAGGCPKKGGTAPSQKGLEMTEAGLAGITETTSVDAATLNRLVPDAEVRPDPDSSDIQELFRGGERIFYVVAKSSSEPAQGVFNVQVTHASIPGPNGWRVGDNLASTANLDMCECWQDLRVCFKKGTHVAVAIDRDDCEGLPEVGTGIIGKPIARLIWNPRPWPEIADYEDMPTDGDGDEDPCGGGWDENPCG